MIEGKTATVRDVLAAEGATRMHEIVSSFQEDGRTPKTTRKYLLGSGEGTVMPIEHAMQFLKDVSFVVTDEAGNRIDPLPVQIDGGIGGMKLQPGETVAHVTELTTTALLKRCKASPFSTGISQDSSREDMIAFIMDNGKMNVGGAQSAEVSAAFAGAGGQMSNKELNKLFAD